jgi:iron complex transport system substrate-binding protein
MNHFHRKFHPLILILLLFQTLTLNAQIQMTDALGRKVVLKTEARRIVSLSPGLTEILFAIGAGKKLVGRSAFCDYPAEAALVATVGGFSGVTVSVEQIASLRPDLVLLSADMHSRLVPLLEALSIPIFAIEPRTFDQVYRTIETIGTLTGDRGGAAQVIQVMRAKIRAVEERIRGQTPPSVFWELYDSPLLTSGGGTFVNEAIKAGGGRNIFEDSAESWPQVSFEQVLIRKPDWILAGSDNQQALDILKRPLWQGIPAVRSKRLALIDADTVYRYGPRLADAVFAIAAILHP